MGVELTIPLMILAIALGIKHSLDADHVVAISSILTRSGSIKRTSTLSTAWAMGHMLTASIITFILYSFKEVFLKPLLSNFEIIVAIMLIIIGVFTLLWEFDVIRFGKHSHGHKHEDGTVHHHEQDVSEETPVVEDFEHGHIQVISYGKEHSTMSLIGVVHGLASNDELLLLLTLTLGFRDFFWILIGVLIFTIGVVIGMVGYGVFLNYPLLRLGRDRVVRIVNVTIALASIAYALYIFAGGETINLFPFVEG